MILHLVNLICTAAYVVMVLRDARITPEKAEALREVRAALEDGETLEERRSRLFYERENALVAQVYPAWGRAMLAAHPEWEMDPDEYVARLVRIHSW